MTEFNLHTLKTPIDDELFLHLVKENEWKVCWGPLVVGHDMIDFHHLFRELWVLVQQSTPNLPSYSSLTTRASRCKIYYDIYEHAIYAKEALFNSMSVYLMHGRFTREHKVELLSSSVFDAHVRIQADHGIVIDLTSIAYPNL